MLARQPGELGRYAAKASIMLDLEHPRTPHVFAASRQLGLILDYAKRITGSDTNGRRFMVQVVASSFEALRWLNTTKFNNSAKIASAIDDLQHNLQTLSDKPATESAFITKRKTCVVCNHPLTKPHEYDPIPYCPDCLDIIMPSLTALRSCDTGFGTEAI